MMSDTEKQESDRSSWLSGIAASSTPIDQANNRRFTFWCIAWAIAILAATWTVTMVEALPKAAAWVIAALPNIFAIGALVSYMRFLRMTDELQRRIQVEGLAVGFGVGWIFAIGYLVLQAAGAPQLPVTAMILVMTAGWIVGTIRAVRHYQ